MTLTREMEQTRTTETVCARCGKPANGECPECEESLCSECADWIQSRVDLICRACKEEADLPKGTYIPYYLYCYSFREALAVSVVSPKDKLSQAQWRTMTLAQQEALLDEWENNETIKKAWERLGGVYRKAGERKKEKGNDD